MKKSKLLVLGVIAIVLAGGLALASCGGGCPGASGSIYAADPGECRLEVTNNRPTQKYCNSDKCGIYNYVVGGGFENDLFAGKKVDKSCDC